MNDKKHLLCCHIQIGEQEKRGRSKDFSHVNTIYFMLHKFNSFFISRNIIDYKNEALDHTFSSKIHDLVRDDTSQCKGFKYFEITKILCLKFPSCNSYAHSCMISGYITMCKIKPFSFSFKSFSSKFFNTFDVVVIRFFFFQFYDVVHNQ